MNQISTTGIILSRINYLEADRIIGVITPNHGKVRLIARGVRKIKSKLAGGIELFCISSLSYIQGRGEISTLSSTRLHTHFGNIVQDYSRTMVGYDILKLIDKSTEDNCDEAIYHLLIKALIALDNTSINIEITKCWFMANLLKLLGHYPNTILDVKNNKLLATANYGFDYQEMGFYRQQDGEFNQNHIKIMRLLIREEPAKLQLIADIGSKMSLVNNLLLNCLEYTW